MSIRIVILLLALVACDDREVAPPTRLVLPTRETRATLAFEVGPDAQNPKFERVTRIKHQPGLHITGSVRDDDNLVWATYHGFSRGYSRFTGRDGRIRDVDLGKFSDVPLQVDIRRRLGSADPEAVPAWFDAKLTTYVELADGQAGEAPLPPLRVDRVIAKLLAGIAQGPIAFDHEPADDPAKHAIAVVIVDRVVVVGDKVTLDQVDQVAIVTPLYGKPRGKRTCSYEFRTIAMRLIPAEAVLYDRRTGAEVERTVLDPTTSCPELVSLTPKEREINSELPADKALGHYKRLLAKR